MQAFLKTPSGDIYAAYRIGGAKAFEGGFILFGTGAEEILEYHELPTAVAIVWRDCVSDGLLAHRPHRPFRQIDWGEMAWLADPVWAAQNYPREAVPAMAPSDVGRSVSPARRNVPIRQEPESSTSVAD